MVRLRMVEAEACIEQDDLGNGGWDIVQVTMAGYPSRIGEVEPIVVSEMM